MKPSARRRHARIVQDVLAVLVEKYPRCFSLTDDERKPLAIGIGGTIIAQHPELKSANIGQALSWYTRSRAYLERLVEGAERVDLGGVAAGIVSAVEAADALERLKAARAPRKITPAEPAPAAPRRLGSSGGTAKAQVIPPFELKIPKTYELQILPFKLLLAPQ
jgi:ProP effector